MVFRIAAVVLGGLLIASVCTENLSAQERNVAEVTYALETDVPYKSGAGITDYERERCRLDAYYPQATTDFATVVWFHGGGLSKGEKSIPAGLKNQGLAVIAANYRLSPQVKSPAYLEDAAAAVAWTLQNIQQRGGSPKRIYLAGHSAGGYLSTMIGLDKRWLAEHGMDANDLAGIISYSGHSITHFAVRAERGIEDKQPIVDELAPLFHVRKDAPRMLLVTGDRDLEMLGRYEESAYFWRMMQEVGHKGTELFELEGFNHGQMAEPAHPLLIRFVLGSE